MTMPRCSSHVDVRTRSHVKIGGRKCVSGKASFVCHASSGGHKRNSDFLRQNKNGFRGRNRQNEDRDNFEDEPEIFSSKNGPLLSLSNSPKFQATATPGPREKEIVELFRKVQAQLRERAAAKEEKRIESVQGQGKETGTVDSLLKLLRKHSAEQGKRKSSNVDNKDFNLDNMDENNLDNEGKDTSFIESNSRTTREPNASSFGRPPSNFRRKSPVTQFKYQPVYPIEDTLNSVSTVNSSDKRRQNSVKIDTIPEHEQEPDTEPDVSLADGVGYGEASDNDTAILEGNEYDEVSYTESNSLAGGAYDEVSENESSDNEDAEIDEGGNKEDRIKDENLTALKLPELRAVAKSRGIKGFSKMKKAELMELLSGSPA